MESKVSEPLLQSLIHNVAIMVEANDHTEARHFIALVFGMRKYASIFSCLMSLQDLEGHIPSELVTYRQNVTSAMFQDIEMLFGTEVVEQIIAVL